MCTPKINGGRLLFKSLRILALFSALLIIEFYVLTQALMTSKWVEPLIVVVHPINGEVGDKRADVQAYINRLTDKDYQPISDFIRAQAVRLGAKDIVRVRIVRSYQIDSLPPVTPDFDDVTSIIWWSIKLQVWSLFNTPNDGLKIKIYPIYHGAGGEDPPASYGMKQGLIAVPHLFASKAMEGSNLVIIAHEMLHTLGATDKYSGMTKPVWPQGYADPHQEPLYPQTRCELMGGRTPITSDVEIIPKSLNECIIGGYSFNEMSWFSSMID